MVKSPNEPCNPSFSFFLLLVVGPFFILSFYSARVCCRDDYTIDEQSMGNNKYGTCTMCQSSSLVIVLTVDIHLKIFSLNIIIIEMIDWKGPRFPPPGKKDTGHRFIYVFFTYLR